MSASPLPSAPRPGDVRVGDRERAEAADRLSAHAAAGRLDFDELDTRLERAQAAVFERELRALEADLPGAAPGRAPRRSSAFAPGASPAPLVRGFAAGARPAVAAPAAAALVVALVAVAVLATAAVGHPVVPPLVAAFLLWRFAHRSGPRPRRSLP
jgi:Domain of unknown function (DUF1707)